MKLIRLAVERPVTTVMFYAALVLMGLIALAALPRELFPTISFPELLVVTRYGAAAPEELENIVTKVIEEQVGTVPNLKRVRSISREGVSVVILEFNWGTDMGLAHLAVREKIDLIKDRLPVEAEEPIVQRHNPFAQPMMVLSVSGNLPLADLTRLADDVVKKRLQKVDGVASASVSGGQEREILVEVDLGKMQSSNISISGVVDSLKTSNVNYPAGTTQGRFYEYLVRTIGEFSKVEDVGKTVVAVDAPRESAEYLFRAQEKRRGGDSFQPKAQRLVPLNAIADVKDAFKDPESFSRHNGKSNVSIAIQKQFEANTPKTARRVRQALEELSLSLPKGMGLEIVYDESEFIQKSLGDVGMAALTGGMLAFLVLLFFFRNLNDSLIVTLALPLSILAVFSCMYLTGRTINVIALAGLSLGIGSIIDNAVCVLENVVRKRAQGMDRKDASITGASEVAVAQLASMLTNVTVFLPLLFAKGLAQQLFRDLFFAAVISNVAALIVALTLLPRITAFPFNSGRAPTPPPGPLKKRPLLVEGLTEERTLKLIESYRRLLYFSMDRKRKVFILAWGMFLASLGLLALKERIFLPKIDQGQFLVRVNMPVGTRLEVTDRVMGKIEKVLAGMGGITDTLVRVGSSAQESIESLGGHQGECVVTLDRKKRKGPTEDTIVQLKAALESEDLEGADVEYLLQDSSLKAVTGGSAPISITVQGPDLGTLRKISDDIQAMLRGVEGCEGVRTGLALPSYETRVSINKDRSSGFGLSASDIARASLIGIRGFVATYFKEEGKEIPIRVRLREVDRRDPSALRRITVRSPQGVMVPLGDVAEISAGYGPSEIQRLDQQRVIVVSAQVLGRSLGEVIGGVDAKLEKYRSLRDYSVRLGGTKQEMQESFGGLMLAFLLAVILIYMIMAAGFESLMHPLLIMITVPLGVIGVAAILFLTGTPLSAPVILGVVLLGGIVVNNGIVLIDHINHLRQKEGRSILEAAVEGSANRLRPVLMTALTSILSLVPTALGLGEGTEVASPMAIATLGGLFVSTVLTLVVLPVLYVAVEEKRSAPPAPPGPPGHRMILD